MSAFDDFTDLLQEGCMTAFEEDSGTVTFTPDGGAATDVRAIFDREALVAESGGEFGVNAIKPMISFQRADFDAAGLSAPVQGDGVSIGGTNYRVVETQPDGRSEYRCILARA